MTGRAVGERILLVTSGGLILLGSVLRSTTDNALGKTQCYRAFRRSDVIRPLSAQATGMT